MNRLSQTINALLLLLLIQPAGAQTGITGFSHEGASREMQLEKSFDANLKVENLDAWMKKLTARPHHLGSPYDKENAAFIADLLKSWGYETRTETYHVLFPTPVSRTVEMVSPTRFVARLQEPTLKEDATSGQTKEQLPTYNCYSADGDVTGELVYVNYGVPEDYIRLAEMGVDVKGKIVIARYGGSWRGIKPKVAQEHGAIGCLIYSDPLGDGYFQGEDYPQGAFKNKDGVQRGSVEDMPTYPGDPLTPGIAATEKAKRIKREEATNLIKIPVQPLSYSDALPLLSALEGPVAPEAWRGALPITYHVGPGSTVVHLKLSFNWQLVECHDVIAVMKGSTWPDEWVVRGNHSDAWVNGATDPVSGLVPMLEEARSLSVLAASGWRPKRTIVFCVWDGEEEGLIGSTEWCEDHAEELQQKAVLYLNSDTNGRGFVYAAGSHTLTTLFSEVAGSVQDPQTKISILERRKSLDATQTSDPKSRQRILDTSAYPIEALGSGSDYTPFLQHLAIPSMNIGFSGENDGGEYHSIYDSYDHFVRFKDPGFAYGIALAQTAGRCVLRMANADVLPFDFSALGATVMKYQKEVMRLLDSLRETTESDNRLLKERRYTYAADPTHNLIVPEPKPPVPYVDFSPLQNAVEKLNKAVAAYTARIQSNTTATDLAAFNNVIAHAEQHLMLEGGLPVRPWYRHGLYAPGYYTGYGVKTMPGVREAIEQRNWAQAEEQIRTLAHALEDYGQQIEKATAMLTP